MKKKIKKIAKDSFNKKLKKLYNNYGMDTSNMSDEEFDRLRELYIQKGKDIEQDLKDSEKFQKKFEDDII